MSNHSEPQADNIYDTLKLHGVRLEEKRIRMCVDEIGRNSRNMQLFLGRTGDDRIPLYFNTHGDGPAYIHSRHAISVPVQFLNTIKDNERGDKFFTLKFRSGSNNMPLSKILMVAGFEETVHYYQDSPYAEEMNLTPFKENDFEKYDELLRDGLAVLCIQEVEARSKVDELFVLLGKNPVNRSFDKRLKKFFPDAYGKTLDELLQMDRKKLKAKLRLYNTSL